MATWNIAIKMGTANTSIFVSGSGIVLSEPTLIALSGDRRYKRVRAIGMQAQSMLGKASDSTTVIAPVVHGIIADADYASLLLSEFIAKIVPKSASFRPRINAIMATPTGLTIEERRMYEEVCFRAGIKTVTLIDNIMLAAIGMDLPVEASMGRLVVNIGAGMTEMGVVSLSGVVTGCSINVGGDMIDRALADLIAGKYNLRVSALAARKIKTEIGSLYANDITKTKVIGLDLVTNNLQTIDVFAIDVMETALPYYTRILEALEGIINVSPPDIASDINRTGVYISGGNSKILGIERLFSQRLGLKVNTCDEPQFACIMGAGKLLSNDILLTDILKNR